MSRGHRKTLVRLVRGKSSGMEWAPDDDVPGARVDIGSGAHASWRIDAAGVKPHHLQLYWDGVQLWAADLHGVGDLQHNGQPIRDWEPLSHGSALKFGGAMLQVSGPTAESIQSSRAQVEEESLSVPTGLSLEAFSEAEEEPTGERGLKNAKTRLVGTPEERELYQPTPAPRPVVGAGVERLDQMKSPSDTRSEEQRPRFPKPPPIGEASSQASGPFGQSPRTLAMGAILVLSFVGVLMMEDPAPEPLDTPVPEDAGAAAPAPEPYLPQVRARSLPFPSEEEIEEGALTPSRRAADALIQGQEWEAADLYAGLVETHPDETAYRIILRTLQRRLLLRCQSDPESEGDRCAR